MPDVRFWDCCTLSYSDQSLHSCSTLRECSYLEQPSEICPTISDQELGVALSVRHANHDLWRQDVLPRAVCHGAELRVFRWIFDAEGYKC